MQTNHLRVILKTKKYNRAVWLTFVIYLLIYLIVTNFIRFNFSDPGPWFEASFSSEWASILFRQRAPFLFESIGSLSLTPWLTFFISVPNLILGAIISYLVGLNISVSYFMFRNLGLKGVKGVSSLLGTIPALLGGAACCAPTLIIVLGLQFTATLTTIWPWFVPVSLILLTLSLYWALHQIKSNLGMTICRNPN